jgi:hypothetical protein
VINKAMSTRTNDPAALAPRENEGVAPAILNRLLIIMTTSDIGDTEPKHCSKKWGRIILDCREILGSIFLDNADKLSDGMGPERMEGGIHGPALDGPSCGREWIDGFLGREHESGWPTPFAKGGGSCVTRTDAVLPGVDSSELPHPIGLSRRLQGW